ncbi:DNA-3-methyladenine glycosylase I [Vibrio sp. HN007]|uniref:DNA-3-methyladenine glycosylase I n=1 Tax=Vibrio iocasae TaxID=3098914 RepID=UPI0035D3F471
MEKNRCGWANVSELDARYHDEEWGREVHDDNKLFECISLEGAQAGLSWSTILKKREGYRKAFCNFDLEKVAAFDTSKIDSLVANPEIVRHRGKIESVVNNARVIRTIQKEYGSLDTYIWAFVDSKPIINNWRSLEDVPASTPLSDQMSKDMKKRGFKFVGTTTMYAFAQAIGLVDDHLEDCWCRKDKC